MRITRPLSVLLLCLLTPAAAAPAQENPLSAQTKFLYGAVQKILLTSAEMTPEEHYAWKPTDAVRTFGQLVGHLADSQYLFCSAVLGEKNPAPQVEKTKTAKADLIAALKEAFAYCDRAYGAMTELQVLDSEHPEYKDLDSRQYHGSAYGMVAAHRGYLRPAGEWNFQEVTVKGSTIQVELNGTVILDADLSKVNQYLDNKPHPGKTRTEGHFGFAGHNNPVAFRAVRIPLVDALGGKA